MKIAFLGDVALIGKYDITQNCENSVSSRLLEVKDILSKFDYVVANLESPLTDIIKTSEYKSMPLRSPTLNVQVLKFLGINAVSLANNHTYDYGKKGLEECIEILDKHQISHFGIGQEPLFVELSHKRIAIQGFCCYTANGWHYNDSKNGNLNTLSIENINSFLSDARRNNCYPIIMPHWGEENTHYPKSEHVYFAKAILEHNICTIVGHHPHVAQGVLRDKNGLCAFSLGNFIFDNCSSDKNGMCVIQTEDNKHGFILGLEFDNDDNVIDTVIPYQDLDNGISIDPSGCEIINGYSSAISELYGKYEYEITRTIEQQKARTQRLGKRNAQWLIKHLNFSSIMTVVQRKKNQKCFANVVDAFSVYSKNISFDGKVLYVGNFGLPKTNAPGKRVYANSLLLTKCGYEVLMIGTDSTLRGRVEPINEKITYLGFPSYGKNSGKQYFEWLKRQIEKTNSKPVMIVRYGSPGLAIFDKYLYTFCHKNKITIINDVVDWLSVDSSNIFFKFIKGFDTYLEKNIFNKRGDGLISISSYLNNYYEKHFKNRIIIPPLVEEYSVNWISNEIPQIVYAGNPFRKGEQVKNFHAIKDRLDIAVNSFIALEQKGFLFDFHIIGLTKAEYLIAFPNADGKLSNAEHIHFHGHQSMEMTQEFISKMDFSILLRERTRGTMAGFPTKVVESLSLGVPVITTDTSDLNKYIHNGINGYIVDINDTLKLEDQLIKIINSNKEMIVQMKNNIINDKEFAVDRYEKQFRVFINALLTRDI